MPLTSKAASCGTSSSRKASKRKTQQTEAVVDLVTSSSQQELGHAIPTVPLRAFSPEIEMLPKQDRNQPCRMLMFRTMFIRVRFFAPKA